MMDISIILPTRGRAALLKRLFNSIAETTANPGAIEIILRMDEDDTESHEIGHPGLNIKKMIRRAGATMGAITNESYAISTGRYIMLMNDDVVFRTQGWDKNVLQAFAKFPDDIALIYGNDLDQGEHMPTFPILSRRSIELFGGVCPSEYFNLCIDAHLFDIYSQLKALGHDRILYLEDTVFEHLHFIIGKSERDNTYIKKDEPHDHYLFLSYADERTFVATRLRDQIEGSRKEITEPAEATKPRQLSIKRLYGEDAEPEVSIIITGKGDELSTKRCLSSLLSMERDNLPFEVLAVSEDNSIVNGNLINILYENDMPIGTSVYNRSATKARGKYLVFISRAATPQAGLLKEMVKCFDEDSSVGAVGCKMLNPRNNRIVHTGIAFFDDSGEMKGTYIYRGFKPDHDAVERRRELQAVSGECFMVLKDLFIRVGGFDEAFNEIESVDLCLKIREQGYKVIYAPAAWVYYDGNLEKIVLPSMTGTRKVKGDLLQILAYDNYYLSRTPDGRRSCEALQK